VIYGEEKLRGELDPLVSRQSPATFVAVSANSEDFLAQLAPFVSRLKTPPISAVERGLERNTAAYWLAAIGQGTMAKLFDLGPAESVLAIAIEDPAIATNALVAMSTIGSASVQGRLATTSLNPQLDESVRETAANQLAFHIQRFGVLMTQDQITDLHLGWKKVEQPAVKAALASVIGSLHPTTTIVGERLKRFAASDAN
jgi:hypothetical protein